MAREQRVRIAAEAAQLRAVLRGAGGQPVDPAEVLEMVRGLRGLSERASAELDQMLIAEVLRAREAFELQQGMREQLEQLLAQATQRPWHPAIYLGPADAGGVPGAMVFCAQAWRVVTLTDEVDADQLGCGDWVLLSQELNAVLHRLDNAPPAGLETATFERSIDDSSLVLRHRDEEVVVRPAWTLETEGLASGDLVRFDRACAIAFERLERSDGGSLFLEETPTVTFADVRGLDDQVARLEHAVLLGLEYPEVVARYGLRRTRGITLAGPSGCGKTLAAQATANLVAVRSRSGRSRFMNIKPSELHSMWYSQSEANYREVFRVARQAVSDEPDVPVVLFFDEVDAIGAARGETLARVGDRVLQSLLAELDGLTDRGEILVIGATNRLDTMDPALLRPGRLGDVVIDVPRPCRSAAEDILDRYLDPDTPMAEGVEREEAIQATMAVLFAPNAAEPLATVVLRDGARREVLPPDLISGAAVENLVRRAKEHAVVREITTGEAGVRVHDLLDAAEQEVAQGAKALTPASCRHHLAGLPQDVDVVAVELASGQNAQRRRFLRSA